MTGQPQERGNLIRRPSPKRGHCATCEPAPKGRVSASELWERHQRRGMGAFVRVKP